MKTILTPVDFSAATAQVIAAAVELTKSGPSQIVILHVVQPPMVTSDYGLALENVQEIFAVNVMANSRCPDVINDQPKVIADSFILPDESLTSVPEQIRFVTS